MPTINIELNKVAIIQSATVDALETDINNRIAALEEQYRNADFSFLSAVLGPQIEVVVPPAPGFGNPPNAPTNMYTAVVSYSHAIEVDGEEEGG